MSGSQDIFKVAILSPDVQTFNSINGEDSIFGYEFHRSYTETQGAAFAFSHFNIDYMRLTAQFWALDSNEVFVMVRNLYLKKTSGLILLIDVTVKFWKEMAYKLIMEFVTVNRFSVPILILTPNDKPKDIKNIQKFKDTIVRWSGYDIPVLNVNLKTESDIVLNDFMSRVKNWRANTVVFQTLKLYFSFDSITREKRSITSIIKHLRKIFISRYIRLVDDEYLTRIISNAAIKDGFSLLGNDVIYVRLLRNEPHEFLLPLSVDDEIKKPKVKKI